MNHAVFVESDMIGMTISEQISQLEFRDEIEGLIREWASRLDLQHWHLIVNLDADDDLATCSAQPQYMTATLNFNIQRMSREILTRRALEDLVLHELVHARLWTLANMFNGADARLLEFVEEEAVTQMTGALLRSKYNDD